VLFCQNFATGSLRDPFTISRMNIQRLFTEHPESVGESYGEHLVRATVFGGRMVIAGIACMLHALLPFIFVRTGSVAIEELHAQIQAVKRRGNQGIHPLASAGKQTSPTA
jgi:Family of unknown function (DUF6356)